MLDEEAGLAHELVGPLGRHLGGAALSALLGVGHLLLFFFVLLLVLDHESVLEDHIEAGFDVIGVEDLFVLFFFVLFVGRRRLGGLATFGLARPFLFLLLVFLEEFLVIDGDVVLVLVEEVLVFAEGPQVLPV